MEKIMYRTEVDGKRITYRKSKYSKEAIEDICKKALLICEEDKKKQKITDFYRRREINYLSSTSDGKYLCNEIICGWLLEKNRIERFNCIPLITRGNPYIVGHNGDQANMSSGRDEEIIAKTGLFRKKFDHIGLVYDYQVPLKDYYNNNEEKQGVGKIDLLSINKDTSTVYVIELKAPNSKETMLRCILEGYTYYKMLDKSKLLEDIKNKNPELINKEIDAYRIVVSPLVFKGSQPYREMEEMDAYRTNLKNLIARINENEYNYEKKNGTAFFGGIAPYFLVEEEEKKYKCFEFSQYRY